MSWPVRMYRLVSEPTDTGLCCGRDGLTFAGVPLLRLTDSGFEPRSPWELRHIFEAACGPEFARDTVQYFLRLQSISGALDAGDLSRAMIMSVMMKFPELDSGAADRLSKIDAILKANFNPMQSRGGNGRWSTEGSNVVPVQYAPRPFPSLFPPLPFPGISGPRRPKDDEDFPYVPQASANQPATDNSRTNAETDEATRSEPEICPPAAPENNIKERTKEQLLYQKQINHLPLGYDVTLNGVSYDGCEDHYGDMNGDMNEAKLLGPWFMLMPEKYRRGTHQYDDIMRQAVSQSTHADERLVKWYFPELATAQYFSEEFLKAGLTNIQVRWEPYNPNNNILRRRHQTLDDFPCVFFQTAASVEMDDLP